MSAGDFVRSPTVKNPAIVGENRGRSRNLRQTAPGKGEGPEADDEAEQRPVPGSGAGPRRTAGRQEQDQGQGDERRGQKRVEEEQRAFAPRGQEFGRAGDRRVTLAMTWLRSLRSGKVKDWIAPLEAGLADVFVPVAGEEPVEADDVLPEIEVVDVQFARSRAGMKW